MSVDVRVSDVTSAVHTDTRRIPKLHAVSVGHGRVVQMRVWEGSGRPVVLLPGMFDSSSGWGDLVLAGDHTCLAIDLAGFGGSSPPMQPRLSAYAEDVVQVLRRVGLGSFTLVGHSLGGGVATAVAERMPRQVASLLLFAPVGFGRVPIAELAALPLARGIVSAVVPHVHGDGFPFSRLYTQLVTRRVSPTEELGTRLGAKAGGVGPGLRAAVTAIAVAGRSPQAFHRRTVRYGGTVTALWGDSDRIVPPSHRRGVVAALPHAHVRVWSGMGHHPHRERLQELADLVTAACEGRPPDSSRMRATDAPRRIQSLPRRRSAHALPAIAGALEA
jgi:pimeloyl-ACP methyl ester carboxylesterase